MKIKSVNVQKARRLLGAHKRKGSWYRYHQYTHFMEAGSQNQPGSSHPLQAEAAALHWQFTNKYFLP